MAGQVLNRHSHFFLGISAMVTLFPLAAGSSPRLLCSHRCPCDWVSANEGASLGDFWGSYFLPTKKKETRACVGVIGIGVWHSRVSHHLGYLPSISCF